MPLRNSVKTKILLKSPDEKFNLKSSPLFSKDLFSSSQKPFPSYFPVKEPFTKDHPLLRPVLPGVAGGGGSKIGSDPHQKLVTLSPLASCWSQSTAAQVAT